jgi:hypothetical protein
MATIDVNSSSFGDVGASKKWARFSFRVSQDKLQTRNFDKNNSHCDSVIGSIRIYLVGASKLLVQNLFLSLLCEHNSKLIKIMK